jgi:hypothetical protein
MTGTADQPLLMNIGKKDKNWEGDKEAQFYSRIQ